MTSSEMMELTRTKIHLVVETKTNMFLYMSLK